MSESQNPVDVIQNCPDLEEPVQEISIGWNEYECANCGTITTSPQNRCYHCYEYADGRAYEPSEGEIEAEAEYCRKQEEEHLNEITTIREIQCWNCKVKINSIDNTYCIKCKYQMTDIHIYKCSKCNKDFETGNDLDKLDRYYGREDSKLCGDCVPNHMKCFKCNESFCIDQYIQIHYQDRDFREWCYRCSNIFNHVLHRTHTYEQIVAMTKEEFLSIKIKY